MDIRLAQCKKLVFFFTIGFYLISLVLPAILFERVPPLYGWEVLLSGWWGIIFFDFGWYANIIYFLSLGAYKDSNNTLTMFISPLAIIVGLSSLLSKEWWFHEGAGTEIIGLGVAFYLWLTSFIVLFVGAFITGLIKYKDNHR
ncbi:hypothetical protein [Thalassotalea agariperforans]